MKIKTVSDSITEIDDKFRVESGPVRRTEVATKELLKDDATATHYCEGAPDANGKKIEIGKKFDFIDWKSRERAFYVYALDSKGVWQKKGAFATHDEAMSEAMTLATKAGA